MTIRRLIEQLLPLLEEHGELNTFIAVNEIDGTNRLYPIDNVSPLLEVETDDVSGVILTNSDHGR